MTFLKNLPIKLIKKYLLPVRPANKAYWPKQDIVLVLMPVFSPYLPPLGLGYLQSYLSQQQVDSAILDLNNYFYRLADGQLQKQWQLSCNAGLEANISQVLQNKLRGHYQRVLKELAQKKVLGFSCFKSNLKPTLDIIVQLRKLNPKQRIVLGGPEISRQYFKSAGKIDGHICAAADLLVAGEGEKPLHDFIKNAPNQQKTVSFVQLNEFNTDFPRYPQVNFSHYPKKQALALQFSRGCIRSCNFCAERLLYQGFRHRSITSIIEEIRFHKEHNQVNNFVFFDSMLNADLRALQELCHQIIASFGSVPWEAQIAVRKDMPLRLCKLMKESGCYNLFIGLESGSDSILEKMRKGFSTQDACDFFDKLKAAELNFGISLIVGYPGETEQEFKESLDFVLANKERIPKIEQINPYTYYDGTGLPFDADYSCNPQAVQRFELFVQRIKQAGMRFTNAYIGNLMQKNN